MNNLVSDSLFIKWIYIFKTSHNKQHTLASANINSLAADKKQRKELGGCLQDPTIGLFIRPFIYVVV